MEKSFGLFFHLKKEKKSDIQKLKVYRRIMIVYAIWIKTFLLTVLSRLKKKSLI